MNKDKTESIKVKSYIVNRVRSNKKRTGVPITIFFENAATEKLNAAKKISEIIKKQKK